ncbi:MAG: 4Fe-4S binding protein [Planctomycetota bacterium]|jgi:ferredoxin-type protein NapH
MISLRGLQLSRRGVQFLVLGLIILTPILARYGNYLSARQLDQVLDRFEGSVQGASLDYTDKTIRFLAAPDVQRGDNMRRDGKQALLASRSLKGTTWSFEFFGLSLTDPLAALESAAASKSVRWVLVLGILVPVALTLLLGRFFCSWICPVGLGLELSGKLRGVLRFLELKPGRVRLWYGNKYMLLVLGIALTFVIGVPFLGYLYPPALMGRELHNGVTVMFDRAEDGLLGFSTAGLTIASWFLLAIALVEVLFGARMWCRSLCPGGAVYSLLGRFRLLRVVRSSDLCTQCGECVVACEMDLNPMIDKTGMECDNCGLCIDSCRDDALHFRFSTHDRPVEMAGRRNAE